jgi:poly(A) polymerase
LHCVVNISCCAGDDIDTLCVGPQWCLREAHFFGQEPYCVEAMLRSSNWVSKIQPVPDAFVPVLKLEIKGIEIDLPYARLPLNELPADLDLQDNNLLRGMDPASITSINGCRVTDRIVQLNTVNGDYHQSFKDALRFLKVS